MFNDLNDIRLFTAVAQAGAVTKGAALLGTPAATVSRRLTALELEIGARLIERSARHFKLTELGQKYFHAYFKRLPLCRHLRHHPRNRGAWCLHHGCTG